MKNSKVIARLRGGMGNQLFCYAAARRLALANDADLVLDTISGFARDFTYRRSYALDCFSILCRLATPTERFEPLERYRRGLKKLIARKQAYAKRSYLEEEGLAFDRRLLSLKPQGTITLDGLWQSENYFKDIEVELRADLTFKVPNDSANQKVIDYIRQSTAVALHVRWFEAPGTAGSLHNAALDYYQRAIKAMEQTHSNAHYFVFSDNIEATKARLDLPTGRHTFVDHNHQASDAWKDMWLMSNCQHFITANSTFSWWAAWLGANPGKVIMTPDMQVDGICAWGFPGLIPDNWIKI